MNSLDKDDLSMKSGSSHNSNDNQNIKKKKKKNRNKNKNKSVDLSMGGLSDKSFENGDTETERRIIVEISDDVKSNKSEESK
jgi:hypothetical protein